jgi:hypothetical protein
MVKTLLTIGNRVMVTWGQPHFDYLEPNKLKDLKPELVGKVGTILDFHPMKGYKVLIDTSLPIAGNNLFWFNANCIRRLSFIESVIDWIKN